MAEQKLPLTTETLEKAVCLYNEAHEHEQDSDILFLHPTCHMTAGLDVSYRKGSKLLTMRCQECKKFVAQVAVAEVEKPKKKNSKPMN